MKCCRLNKSFTSFFESDKNSVVIEVSGMRFYFQGEGLSWTKRTIS